MQHLLLWKELRDGASVGDVISLTPENSKHLAGALRMAAGDELTVTDGRNTVFSAELLTASSKAVDIVLRSEYNGFHELPYELVIYQGIPKGEKMEWIIQKCTELGAVRIVPVDMSRCIAKIRPDKADKKIRRYQEIADAAASQSKRIRRVEIGMPISFAEALKEISVLDERLMAYEAEHAGHLGETAKRIRSGGSRSIALLIGPEGGISEEEAEQAKAAGVTCTSLGSRILRTETAAMAVASYLMLRIEEKE